MAGEFEGKLVMITGASGGLGWAVVQRFHDAGANLALVGRRKSALDQTLDDMADTVDRSKCFGVVGDVTDQASMRAAVAQIAGEYGRIDALAHTVGGYAGGKAVHEGDLDLWQRMMTLNATSVYITAGAVAHYMVQQKTGGHIVVVLARHALAGQKNHAAYGASKAAAQRIVQSMAQELLDHDINVNGIVPGTIDTPANRAAMLAADFSKWVMPEAIADVILFLCSSRAGCVSGDSVSVYGRS